MKKKLLLTLSLCFMLHFLFAQRFVTEGHQWNMTQTGTSITTGETSKITWEYKLEDTVFIDEVPYLQLYKRQEEVQPDWEVQDESLYREANGKVYRYRQSSGTEDLIYDFNIDSLDQLVELTEEVILVTTTIDSVEMLDGSKRRRIQFDAFDIQFTLLGQPAWIEGIGELVNPFAPGYLYPVGFDASTDTLDCYYESEELNYVRALAGSCYTFIVSTEQIDKTEPDVRIYPIPFRSELNIESPQAELKRYTLTNNLGEVLIEGPITGEKTQLNLETLPKGIYHLVLYDKGGNGLSRELVKW